MANKLDRAIACLINAVKGNKPTLVDLPCGDSASGTSSYEYINADNATEVTFSIGGGQFKWQIELGQQAEADGTGPFVADCIASGEGCTAVIDIIDQDDNPHQYTVTGVGVDGSTDGAWLFEGSDTGGTGTAGKVKEARITCSCGTAVEPLEGQLTHDPCAYEKLCKVEENTKPKPQYLGCYKQTAYTVKYNNGAVWASGDSCWGYKYRDMCGEQSGWGFLNYPHTNYRGNICDWSVDDTHVISGNNTVDSHADWAALFSANDPFGNQWVEVPDAGSGIRCGAHIQTQTTNPAAVSYGRMHFRRNWRNYAVWSEPQVKVDRVTRFDKLCAADGTVYWLDDAGTRYDAEPENLLYCGDSASSFTANSQTTLRLPNCQSVRVCPDPVLVVRDAFCAIYDGTYVVLREVVDIANGNSVVDEYWVDLSTGQEVAINDPTALGDCDGNEPTVETVTTCYKYVGVGCGDPSTGAVRNCLVTEMITTVTPGSSFSEYYVDGTVVTVTVPPDFTDGASWEEICCKAKPEEIAGKSEKTFTLANIYRYNRPDNGVNARYWGDVGLTGNAAPHGNVSDIWSDKDTHINGAADLEGVISNITTDWNVVDELDPTGVSPWHSNQTGQVRSGGGQDQYSQQTFIIANTDTIYRDSNGNTGERVGVYLGVCGCTPKLVKETTVDTGAQGTPAGLGVIAEVGAGVVELVGLVSDLSAWSGFQLQQSTDGGATWQNVDNTKMYISAPKWECIPVWVCHEDQTIWSFDKSEQITFDAETDSWCQPVCQECIESDSSGSSGTSGPTAEEIAEAIIVKQMPTDGGIFRGTGNQPLSLPASGPGWIRSIDDNGAGNVWLNIEGQAPTTSNNSMELSGDGANLGSAIFVPNLADVRIAGTSNGSEYFVVWQQGGLS